MQSFTLPIWLHAVFAVVVGLLTAGTGMGAEPLHRAHAHNDYEHERPLLDALQHGFCSVEADVFAVDGKLLVAHNLKDTKPDRTLEVLYLKPLSKIARQHAGYIYPDKSQLTLLIDFKTPGEQTYPLLASVLRQYSELLQPHDKVAKAAVQVVVSGNRPFDLIAGDSDRLVGIDGRLSDLDSNLSSDLMPMISDNWSLHFAWRGIGDMSVDEQQKLRRIAKQCHASGRRLRFWATPESETLWRELVAAEVDHINTDQLARLAEFLSQP